MLKKQTRVVEVCEKRKQRKYLKKSKRKTESEIERKRKKRKIK